MKQINNRNNFAELLTELGLTGEAAFVGVAEGQFEKYFMDRWAGRASWIDPWRILDTPGFSGHGEDNDDGQEARYLRVLRTASKLNGRVKVLRMTSEEAAPRFADGSLDFLYLDAQHDFPSIKRDLELWIPKAKSGALCAGHDFLDGAVHGGSQEYGVKRAVSELAEKIGVTVNVTPETWPSWYFVKP